MYFDKVIKFVKFHGMHVVRGLVRTVYGSLTAGLIALAVYGFVATKSESGYVAVFDFVSAVATLIIALCNVYVIGQNRKRGSHAR